MCAPKMIENDDDPDLVELEIGAHGYAPDDGDWGRLGIEIGRNTHLKELCYSDRGVSKEDFEKLFRGIACNKSIQKLSFTNCRFFGGAIFSILVPFFKNSNFECLEIDECALGREEINSLSSAMSAVDSSRMKLFLREVYIKRGAFDELAALLQNPKSKLALLDLGSSLGNEEAAIVATGLSRNSTLRELNLSENSDISEEGWRAIFTALQSPSCRLEKLSLYDNDSINDTAALSLSQALTINIHITSLNMSYCRGITVAGWRGLFECLQSPNCVLGMLYLSRTGLNDETVGFLANALVNNARLRELNLYGNPDVTATGWEAFFAVLQSPHSALEKLDLRINAINDETVVSLANSLVNNSKLKELLIECSNNTASGWAAFPRVLCNASSIMDTYDSNHTLQRLSEGLERLLPEDVRSMLQLNRANTPSQAARLKIIRTHFTEGFVAQPFIDMELNVLPNAIAWMGRDDGAGEVNEHFYGFLRNMPSLFDVESHKTPNPRASLSDKGWSDFVL